MFAVGAEELESLKTRMLPPNLKPAPPPVTLRQGEVVLKRGSLRDGNSTPEMTLRGRGFVEMVKDNAGRLFFRFFDLHIPNPDNHQTMSASLPSCETT